ncbi:hypothetical protein TVAG_353340 [Trichomonas vaginalis G3]|uniref:Uncharacterized protein n=1 Tax=Trichomonas vaginalis (strain ATCC PRA-98 / G3) TaxID=412133 RepID=A2EN57_TRIV3|nr:hypothetical protein TVAGG3_0546510 [Trichomonas vaginalis G3]EAY05894.1 hypothetical protein TVAG_353340 [Trichomonas vaginalis G3]KAI5520222.1 hypothetical protein TVAGG3_0546510 [Trichomonas vaginalis G3]|eukprot:XP_001318117.1 hypothetical protein [Trichomonas vaginalis G3]
MMAATTRSAVIPITIFVLNVKTSLPMIIGGGSVGVGGGNDWDGVDVGDGVCVGSGM